MQSCINCRHASLADGVPTTREQWLADEWLGRDGICPHSNAELPRWVACDVPAKDGRLMTAHRLYRCELYERANKASRLDADVSDDEARGLNI